MTEQTGLSGAEILRRGLRAFAERSLGKRGPGWSLETLIGALGDAPGVPTDLAAKHDDYLYGGKGGRKAAEIIRHLLDDPAYEWLDVPTELVRESAERWVARFPDRRFTLADAVSFEVMRRRKVKQAFAYDRQFAVAGFEVAG